MKLRSGSPKYSGWWGTLFPLGFLLIWLSRFVGQAADWLFCFGSVLGAVGIIVFFAGWIAERKEWKARQDRLKL